MHWSSWHRHSMATCRPYSRCYPALNQKSLKGSPANCWKVSKLKAGGGGDAPVEAKSGGGVDAPVEAGIVSETTFGGRGFSRLPDAERLTLHQHQFKLRSGTSCHRKHIPVNPKPST